MVYDVSPSSVYVTKFYEKEVEHEIRMMYCTQKDYRESNGYMEAAFELRIILQRVLLDKGTRG